MKNSNRRIKGEGVRYFEEYRPFKATEADFRKRTDKQHARMNVCADGMLTDGFICIKLPPKEDDKLVDRRFIPDENARSLELIGVGWEGIVGIAHSVMVLFQNSNFKVIVDAFYVDLFKTAFGEVNFLGSGEFKAVQVWQNGEYLGVIMPLAGVYYFPEDLIN